MSVTNVTAPARVDSRWRIAVATLRLAGLLGGLGAVAGAALISLRYGSIDITTRDAWDAIFAYDASSYEQTVVRHLRVPRTVFALVVGCGLGVAGAVMQGVTRNPLADPFILGVSAAPRWGSRPPCTSASSTVQKRTSGSLSAGPHWHRPWCTLSGPRAEAEARLYDLFWPV